MSKIKRKPEPQADDSQIPNVACFGIFTYTRTVTASNHTVSESVSFEARGQGILDLALGCTAALEAVRKNRPS